MDQETEALLVELRGAGQTDLARLIEQLARHRGRAMVVAHAAVAAWESRAPEAWHMASASLARREIPIIVIAAASDAQGVSEELKAAREGWRRLSSAHENSQLPSEDAG